jgi:hypothetical protein
MAEGSPQQPVEQRVEPVHTSERGKGLNSMMVPAPVPAWELPDATPPQASAQNATPVGDGASPQASVGGDTAQPQPGIGGDGASQQGSAQDAAPVDYDG